METNNQSQVIAQLNDAFRKTFVGGLVMITHSVQALPQEIQDAVLAAVQSFNDFNEDNDPYCEHDFGAVQHNGCRFFWKIDYYVFTMDAGSENPSDPSVTK
jgi:hypothetical protein